MPERVQQRRAKGWRKPENTVSVARPSRWGNPFRITPSGLPDFPWQVRSPTVDHLLGLHDSEESARAHVVELFEMHIGPMGSFEYDSETLAKLRHDLGGKNLMCFCPLDQPCHADVLLAIANDEIEKEDA